MHAYNLNLTSLILQEAKDPKHMSKSVHYWFNFQEFTFLKELAQSPHLYATLKHQLKQYETPPKKMLEL